MNRPTPMAMAFAGLISSILVGCGESGPSLVKVTGTVTMNDKPVEGAVVSFLPDPSHATGRPAEDLTGPEGNYRVTTNGRTGVVPGKYHIVVTKAAVIPGADDPRFKDDPYMAQMSAGMDTKSKRSTGAIDASFDRDVAPEGGVIDLDIKAAAAKPKK